MPTRTPNDFVIVPDDASVAGTYPSCFHLPEQQVYTCEIENIGLINFENLDGDAWDIAVQPVNVINKDMGFRNTLNAFMDHRWDGFYTS